MENRGPMQCYGTSHGTFLKSRRHSKQAFYFSCRRQHFVLFHHLAQIAKRSVFHAFTFEAYLNHVGPQEIESWKEIERKISYREKLSVLSKRLDFKCEPGRRPFQTIWTPFDLRDNLAHGKTIEIKHEFETSRDPPGDSAWCVLLWERLTVSDLEKIF